MGRSKLLALFAGLAVGAQAMAAVNVAVESSAAPLTATTQNLTDANIDTLDAAIIFFSRGIATNTIAEEGGLSIGFVDGAGDDRGISVHSDDNIGTATDVLSEQSATNSALMADAATDTSIAEAAGAAITDGAQLTWSQVTGNRELVGAFLTGNDGAADARTLTLNGTTPVTVTHALGATADLIVAISTTSASSGNAINPVSVGFYDVAGTTYRAVSQRHAQAATTTNVAESYWNNAIIVDHNATTQQYSVTVSNCDADSCDFVADQSTTDVVYLMFYSFPAGVDIQVGDFTTKTSTGTNADITGMTDAPTAVLYLTTFMPTGSAVNTVEGDSNEGESFGFGVAVNNGGTEIASTAFWDNDGAVLGATNTKSLFSNSAIVAFNGTGALGYAFNPTWDSAGVTHNYTTVDATARRVIYAAIGPQAGGGGGAASFGTTPFVSSQSTDSYTVGYNTDNANPGNFFLAALKKDSAACTCDDIEANTCAGEVAYATEAATDAADAITITIPGGDPFPVYDLQACAEGAGGDSAVVAMNDELLDPPAGRQYVAKSGSPAGAEEGLLDDASPAAADGDYIDAPTHTDSITHGAAAHCLTVNADTTYIVKLTKQADCTSDSLLDTSSQRLTRRFYDVSVGDWSDASAVLYCVNNQPPIYVGPDIEGDIPFLFEKDVALSMDLDSLWSDSEADDLSHNVLNLPTGLSEDGEDVTGTPTVYGYNPTVTLEVADECTDEADQIVDFVIGFRVPDVLAFLQDERRWQTHSIFVANDDIFRFGT
jgi:hypothetical protein